MPKLPKRELTPKQVGVLVDAMTGKSPVQIAKRIGGSHAGVIQKNSSPEAVGYWNAREQKKQAELQEILDVLQDMIRKEPESAFRWADKIAAVKLKSELDGHLKTNTEEKHLHIHGVQLDQLSESQLRSELAKMQSSNRESGTPSVQ